MNVTDRSQTEESTKQIRGSSLLLAGRVFSLLANLATQVLAVRYLTKADYGAFAFALSSIELLAYVSMLGLDKACARFLPIYHERLDYERALGTWIMCVATAAGVALSVVTGVVLGQKYLNGTLVSNELSLSLLLILIALAPVEALDFIFEAFFGAFGNVKSVFYRRYILRPTLKLMAVAAVLAVRGDAVTLAYCYLFASCVGFAYYIPAFVRVLKQQDLLDSKYFHQLRFPVREVFAFTGPLISSHFVFLCQGSVAILLLEAMSGNVAVGEFRAVFPFARLNIVVEMCFTLLYTPLAARFLSRQEARNISNLFWNSTVWITVLTFPIMALTTVFSKQLTVLMLGQKYANASPIMMILAVGLIFEATLGLCSQTLRVYAKIRYILIADGVAALCCLVMFVVLIPRYDAVGAAIATASFNTISFLLHMGFTHLTTDVKTFVPGKLQLFLSAVAGLIVLALAGHYLQPGWVGVLLLTTIVWAGVLYWNRADTDVEHIFPEIQRIPVLNHLFSPKHPVPTKESP